MKIAIVILNWNGKQLLEEFVPFIVKYSDYPNVEIVVADNASTDESVSFIKKNYTKIKIVQNIKNGAMNIFISSTVTSSAASAVCFLMI